MVLEHLLYTVVSLPFTQLLIRPHADLAKPGSFTNDTVFPFVAVHGFGLNEFQRWLLPSKHKREHGFLSEFYVLVTIPI